MYFSLPPPLPSSPSIPSTPKCIYEHLFGVVRPPFRSPDGPFPVDRLGAYAHLLVLIIAMFIVLIILILLILGILVYFGSGFVWKKAKRDNASNPPSPNELSQCENSQKESSPPDPFQEKQLVDNYINQTEYSNAPHPNDTKGNNFLIQETVSKVDDQYHTEMENHSNPDISESQLNIETLSLGNYQKTQTPEGSPKSTSSCISSDILTESLVEEEEEEEPSPTERVMRNKESSNPSRPSSFPLNFSTSSSSSISFFNFTRKTPEFVPRMMLEEFESLDRSIEKRKIDIRDLLKRIESAKRRHRRFSEHLQRVQLEHNINY